MKIQRKRSNQQKLSVIVPNVMDCLLIDKRNFYIDIGIVITHQIQQIENLHFNLEQETYNQTELCLLIQISII